MAGANSTTICYDASLQQCSSSIICSHESMAAFRKTMGGALWRVNMLVLVNAILAGVIVSIGAYAQRYRHHPFTRFIYLGASTLLLPITSYVVSTISTNSNHYTSSYESATLAASCRGGFHYFTAVSWAFLVQITMINTSVIVAVDEREGRNRGPPVQLLVQGLWTLYLGVSAMGPITANIWPFYLELMLFAIICAKTVLKYYAFEKARRSLAFGRNPRLVSGYMEQEQVRRQPAAEAEPWVGDNVPPPPLLVMGEDGIHVENHPHGYAGFVNNDSGLVTFDKVWNLGNERADLCLSFALFKLLRCRFAGYKNANVTASTSAWTPNFFWKHFLLQSREGNHHARVFGVIADELSFIQDYYFSSLPVSYSKHWLPIVSVSISLLSITYCILATIFIMMGLISNWKSKYNHQLRCHFWCNDRHLISNRQDKNFGFFVFDDIPLFLLLALVMLAEVKYIASYICSNWTKVSLICYYIRHAYLQHYQRVQEWFGILLQCKWGLMKHWDEKIGQSSILVLHPRRTLLVLLRRLLGLPDLDRSVKLQEVVKVRIIDTLRRNNHDGHQLSNGVIRSPRQGRAGEMFPSWAFSSNGTSETILTWHIATSILEVRHPFRHDDQEHGSPVSDQRKIAATHLSRYCAYLMTWSPELLPDEEAWSKGLYEAVKEDTVRVLADRAMTGPPLTPEAEYEDLVKLLSGGSNHSVVKNGVLLGKQLVEFVEGEEAAWAILAGFWAEMILYVAPSNNLKGHRKAIARGGELITLLWALLFHAGIVSRPDETGNAATAGGGV